MFIFKYTISYKKELKSMLILDCVISYGLISFISLLRNIIPSFLKLPDIAIINSALACISGIVISIIFSLIYNSGYMDSVITKLFHKTPYNDIWRDVIDLSNGSNLKVFLRDKTYYIVGHHYAHEENGNDSWIAISAFAKYDINTNELCINEPCFLDKEEVKYVLKLSDVDHIEIF